MDRAGRTVVRRLMRGGRAARPALALTAVTAIASAALVVGQAALLADVIARAFLAREGLGRLGGELYALAAVLVLRAVLAAVFEHAGRRGAIAVMSELRGRLAEALLVRRPGLAGGARSGELATAAVQGVDALEGWFALYLPQALLAAVVPPAVLAYGATRDLTATVVLALTVPVLIVFMVLVGLAAQGHARRRWRALSVLGAHFADVVRELDVLRAHRREAAQAGTIAAVSERYRRATMGTLRVAFLSALTLELVAMIGTALVAATVGLQLAAGHVALADGLCVLLLAPELYAPLRGVGQQFHAASDGLAGAERLLEVLDTPACITAGGTAAAPDPRREPIVMRGVRYTHPDAEQPALAGVDLELRPGETLALTGPSGAGKSTLAALLLRLADPEAGELRCGGVELRDVDLDAWRAQVAWVPQRPMLTAGSLADNVRLARPGASAAEVDAALRRAGLDGLLAELPAGAQTRVGDGGRPLSAGEAQRVALARAFVRDAALVVLDEPTAHLDAATAAEVERALLDLCADRTALLIAHRLELALGADRIVTLDAGRVVAHPRVEVAAA